MKELFRSEKIVRICFNFNVISAFFFDLVRECQTIRNKMFDYSEQDVRLSKRVSVYQYPLNNVFLFSINLWYSTLNSTMNKRQEENGKMDSRILLLRATCMDMYICTTYMHARNVDYVIDICFLMFFFLFSFTITIISKTFIHFPSAHILNTHARTLQHPESAAAL